MASELFLFTGIPGSGKTVLFSVLTLRYGEYFFPKNSSAQEFCDNAQILTQQQWPPATNPLSPQKAMQWDFTYNGGKNRLILLDKAGESWTTFVRENQEPSLNPTNATVNRLKNLRNKLTFEETQGLKTIEEVFRKTACVCVLLDLSDDINKGKNNEQKNFVIAIINYLEKIGRTKCPIALVITKCTTYGEKKDWESITEEYRTIFKNHWDGKVEIIETDAVAETETNTDGELVPAAEFPSQGLDELLNWIFHKTDDSAREKKRMLIILVCIIILLGLVIIFFVSPWLILLGIVMTVSYFIFKNKKKIK